MWHTVVEGSLDNYEATCEREIKDGVKQQEMVTFKYNNAFTTDDIADLKNRANILIGNKSYTNACVNVTFQNSLVGYARGALRFHLHFDRYERGGSALTVAAE